MECPTCGYDTLKDPPTDLEYLSYYLAMDEWVFNPEEVGNDVKYYIGKAIAEGK